MTTSNAISSTSYTRYNRPTRPVRQSGTTYENTPEVLDYGKLANAKSINMRHRSLSNYSISGFAVSTKGMAVIIGPGSCLLRDGETAHNLSHYSSVFYINRDLPLAKTETYYLAIDRVNSKNGNAVLFLFNGKKDITANWLVLKKLIIPINATDLSELKAYSTHNAIEIWHYNYVPNQPDGVVTSYYVPYKINPKSVILTADGKSFGSTDLDISVTNSNAIIKTQAIFPYGSRVYIDFAEIV